jgi:hypothetical protein
MNFDDISLGIVIGIGIVLLYAWYRYQRLKSQIDHLLAPVIDKSIMLEIEVDNGQYFCYNIKDKQFICQGKTVAEIQHAFQNRFPDKIGYLVGEDPVVMEKLKAELTPDENSTGI